jgi:hypothetical protein
LQRIRSLAPLETDTVPLPDHAPASIANGPESSAQSGEQNPTSATTQMVAASRSNPEDFLPMKPSPRPVAAIPPLAALKPLRSGHPSPPRFTRIAAFLGAVLGLH